MNEIPSTPEETLLALEHYRAAQRSWATGPRRAILSDDTTDDTLVGAFTAEQLARMPAAHREWFEATGLAEGMSAAEVWQECLEDARMTLAHTCDPDAERCDCLLPDRP
jgi:hypothetical protein